MRCALLLLVLTASAGWAEHGGTKAYEEKMRRLREEVNGKVRYQDIQLRWSRDAVVYRKEGGKGWIRVALETGERSEIMEQPDGLEESRVPADFAPHGEEQGKEGPKGTTSPDGKWTLQVGKQEIVLRPGEGGEGKVVGRAGNGWRFSPNRVLWSHDSQFYTVWKSEDRAGRQVTYVESSPDDQLQPKTFTRDYTKPGDELSVERPVIFPVAGEPIMVEESLCPNAFMFRRHRWREGGAHFVFEYIERGFGKHRLIEIDARKRRQRIVVREDSETFVFVFGKSYRWDLDDGKEILWLSERDGWNHLYLMDGESGKVKKQLTSGKWLVQGVEAVDEEKREALLRIIGYHPGQDPYFRHWARLDLSTGALTLLTDANGTHRLSFSPDRSHYVARWSRVDHPPVYELRRTRDGKLVCVLERADAQELFKTSWQMPEVFVAKDRNGEHDIWGAIWRPRDFDPRKKYAVIEQIYAGPHGSFVPKDWQLWSGTRSSMAESGFIVVQIDGLGTSNRCREFHHFCYKNLRDAGLPDRIAWMKAAASRLPQMDLERVGIFGGSAGGQSALGALLFHGDFYDAAVADCGCHDNRMDKVWWNEQWMDWPLGPHYAANSNVTHAARLQGDLLLTVGEVDTNVDPSSTMQVANALIKADRDFELLVVPGAGHGVGERPYLKRKRVEFFQRTLGGPILRR